MIPSFTRRSEEKELLDAPGILFTDIERNMSELDIINSSLGGHTISWEGLCKLYEGAPSNTPLRVTEIGCGGGDNLRAIREKALEKGWKPKLTGVDINPECIAYAKQRAGDTGINFICSDYRDLPHTIQSDIIFSSLFCHHFTDTALVTQLQWMHSRAKLGFFINDLHRHPLAYYSIKWLTRFFSKSYLVQHDAPLSVLRGFRKREWNRLLQEAGVPGAQIHWRWAFRWLIVSKSPK